MSIHPSPPTYLVDPLSPFLPDSKVQYAFDSTSLGWLKKCPRLYQYSMIEGYQSSGLSVHLTFGLVYHSALETYDRARAIDTSHDDAVDAAVDHALNATWDTNGPWVSDDTAKNRENLIRSIVWYLDQFKDDPAKTIILANGKPAVELSFRMELDFGPADSDQSYIISGHLDRLVEFAGDIYVMDRKTTKQTLTDRYFDQYQPDNQMTLYTMASQVIYETAAKGVIIDALQSAVGFSRFQRGITFRTPLQINEWLVDTKYWLRQAEGFARDGYWPQNDKACWGCAFRSVCSKDPSVRQNFLDSNFTRREWNPLEPR